MTEHELDEPEPFVPTFPGGIDPAQGTPLTFIDALRAVAIESGETSEAVTW